VSAALLDPNFEDAALLRTNDAGRYRILTVKPGACPDPGGGMSTPHIHFDVTSDEYSLVLCHPQSRCISLCITGSPSSKRHRDSAAYIELLHF
jgi:hypothetical protein